MSLAWVPLFVCLLALLSSLVLTDVVRRYALRSNLLDVPNSRSSHETPTPRGGGMAMVVVVCAGLLLLAAIGYVPGRVVAAVVPAALLVAIAGFVDDRRSLPPAARLAAHFAAAVAFLLAIGGPPSLGISWIDGLPWVAMVLTVLGLVWLLNLFNFMDGIDGIAGVELVFVSFALALVSWRSETHGTPVLTTILLGSAGLGFLFWNWPPAKIFMGDVGSGFAGIVLGMVGLLVMRECGVTVWVPLILVALFVTDATLTLLRRALRRERLSDAHRTHAYQWLSRRWGSHQRVVFAVLAINLFWLLPMALLAQLHPEASGMIAATVYLPVIVFALWAGAGSLNGTPSHSR